MKILADANLTLLHENRKFGRYKPSVTEYFLIFTAKFHENYGIIF